MSDNAQPTVITAAEFVSGGYAQRVAAGECVVYALTFKVQDVKAKANGYLVQWVPLDNNDIDPCNYFGADTVPQLHIEWTAPATPATDELASLRALVARYRAALEAIVSSSNAMYAKANRYPQNDALLQGAIAWSSAARIARAALAETEEA